jgi:E3 ubiquitin-protein ligase CHFR
LIIAINSDTRQNTDSTKSSAWAQLVSLDLSLSTRISTLTKDSYTIGKATTDDIQIFDDRVDDVHYRIYKETHDGSDSYWIENLSRNGTVEDNIVYNRNIQQLDYGDRIGCLYLNDMKSDVILTYAFCSTIKESNKRFREEDQQLLEENKEHEKHKCTYNGEKNDFECTICLSLIYDCAIVLPCLHNFCASCISTWILESKVCPNCKQEYSDLRKDFRMNIP